MASTNGGDLSGDGARGRGQAGGVEAYEIQRMSPDEPAVPWPAASSDVHSAAFVTAKIALMETRMMSEEAATSVLQTRRCEECECSLDKEHDRECMCPCHCACCCPPLFRCVHSCKCECDCHYVPAESGDEGEPTGPSSSSGCGEVVGEVVAQSPVSSDFPSANSTGPASQDDAAKRGEAQIDDGSTRQDQPTEDEETSDDEDERAPQRDVGDGAQRSDSGDEKMNPDEGASGRGSESQTMIDVPMAQAEPQASGSGAAPTKPSVLFQELVETLQRVDEQSHEYGSRLLAELFEAAYRSAVKVGMKKVKESALPATTDVERELLYLYGSALIQTQKTGFQRFWTLLCNLALATTKSAWAFKKILADRVEAAKAPQVAPANVWTQRTQPTASLPATGPLQPQQVYIFDELVYAPAEIALYREICAQQHVFAKTTRQPTPDEWAIMCGIMNGSILARAMPQFLKRCCQMRQFTWFHQETLFRAEGELWAPLPPLSKVYNYNQSSRRLVRELRQAAIHLDGKDDSLTPMLDAVKAASYDMTRHALHLFFYTKAIAAQWEGLQIPFRNSKLVLRNPDSVASQSAPDQAQGSSDGMANDRYQAHYKLRLSNVSRTLDIDHLAAFLQELTKNALQIGVPLDSYGPNSDWSLLWDFYSKTAACPPALKDINRIMWDGHPIMVQHRPEAGIGACLLCAQTGHKMATCTVPETERIGKNTLVVSASEMAATAPQRRAWSTPEDALAIFLQLGEPTATPEQPVSGPHEPTSDAPAAEEQNGATDGASGGQSSASGASAGVGSTAKDGATTATDSAKTATSSAGEPPHNASKDNAAAESQRSSSNQWQEVQSRRSRKKKKSKTPKSSSESTAAASIPQLFRRGASVTTPATINLTGDADNESSDNEADDEMTGSVNPKDHEDTPKPVDHTAKSSRSKAASQVKRDADVEQQEAQALEQAVKLARLEKFRLTLIDHMAHYESSYSTEALTAAIDRAMGNILATSSKAWVLEAVNGRLAGTLATGNCQFYGMAELLHQLAMYKSPEQESMVETTMLVKYGLWLASKAVEDEEELRVNMAAILATPSGTPLDETTEERLARTTKYFTELATSDSAVASKLPEHLWGGWDTLRMFSLLVNRPVFLISEHKGPHDVYLNVLQPQKSKNGNPTVAILQPGTAEWLQMVRADGVAHDRAPLVLNYRDKHYDAVLLDRHAPTTAASSATRQTTLTSLVPSLPSLDTLIQTAKKGKSSELTRQEVLDADASLTRDDVTDFLANESWSVVVKKELISLLVSGDTNFREVLIFSTESDGDSGSASQSSVQTVDVAQPPSGSEYSMDSGDDEEDSSTTSQAYSLPTQDGQTYRDFADAMWEAVREEWQTQHSQPIPRLTDQAALRKLAVAEPALMCELGRWCDHPLILLDHFRPEWIKEWMEVKRQQYLISRLTTVVDRITDEAARTLLHQWLQRLQDCGDRLIVRAQIRDQTAWDLLKTHAATMLKGGAAGAFVTRDYSVKSAYIFVLDELLPDLARHVLANQRGVEPEGPVSLADAYQHSSALRTALDAAVSEETWSPFEAFMTQLHYQKSGAAAHQY